MKSVAQEMLALAALAKVDVEEVQHFIVGLSGSPSVVGSIDFTVPGDHCAVVVKIEEFNADDALTRTVTRSEAGAVITEVEAADWTIGADVFLWFPPGSHSINLAATPVGGKSYFARLTGYLLPQAVFKNLSRMGTKIL